MRKRAFGAELFQGNWISEEDQCDLDFGLYFRSTAETTAPRAIYMIPFIGCQTSLPLQQLMVH